MTDYHIMIGNAFSDMACAYSQNKTSRSPERLVALHYTTYDVGQMVWKGGIHASSSAERSRYHVVCRIDRRAVM